MPARRTRAPPSSWPKHEQRPHFPGAAASAGEQPLPPPLVAPVYVDDVTMYEFFQRYRLLPLTPFSRFEYQLVQIAAALEQRIRELDPDA